MESKQAILRSYLNEDLMFDVNHCKLTLRPNYVEVGWVFNNPHKIQITWNAWHMIFHKELVNLNQVDDFGGDYELCKT